MAVNNIYEDSAQVKIYLRTACLKSRDPALVAMVLLDCVFFFFFPTKEITGVNIHSIGVLNYAR